MYWYDRPVIFVRIKYGDIVEVQTEDGRYTTLHKSHLTKEPANPVPPRRISLDEYFQRPQQRDLMDVRYETSHYPCKICGSPGSNCPAHAHD